MFAELPVSCSSDEFKCRISGKDGCIPKEELCDGVHQCSDGTDEDNCGE